MAGEERAIFTNMCMIYDDDGNILVQDRVNPDWSGVTFPGGHAEAKESFISSVIREVKEETGLNIENPVLCGIKQFQTKSGARYIVLFYKTNKFSGELVSSDEGRVFWIKRSELENYSLADDFADMVSLSVPEPHTVLEKIYRRLTGVIKSCSSPLQLRLASLSFLYIFPKTS